MPLDEQQRTDEPSDRSGSQQDDKVDARREERRRRARPIVWIGLGIFAVIIVAGGIYYWWSTRNQVTTDDAYTDGYATAIAPHISGYVVSLDIRDNEFVHAGQALVHIDPRDFIAARSQAQGTLDLAEGQLAAMRFGAAIARKNFPARLAQAQAQLGSAEAAQFRALTEYNRQKSLPHAATTQQAVDDATASLRSADAQVALARAEVQQAEPVPQSIGQADAQVRQLEGTVAQAQAQFEQAELNLSRTVVRAPSDGWVTKRVVDKGSYVQQGQEIMSVVSPVVWITANFKETQLTRMRPGQPVKITVDAYPDLKLRGHVDSIQQGSGAEFSTFPPENATGNFVKIVRRVPVKIDLERDANAQPPLPLGISVEPTVDVK